MSIETSGLVISPAVLQRIGTEKAEQFRSRTRTFTCTVCTQLGDTRLQAASLVIWSRPGLSRLGFTHTHCSPSQVVELTSAEIALPGTFELVPRAIALPNGTAGHRAALLLAVEEDTFYLDEKGDPRHVLTEYLLSAGLHRLTSLGRMAPSSPGWSVVTGPAAQLIVTSRSGPILEEGQMYAPPQWLNLVRDQGGTVLLLAGRLEYDAIHAEEPPLAAYMAAVRSGDLLGGSAELRVDA